MTTPVTLPLWLFLLIIAFAAVTFASHFLFPSVRWFFRRRAEKFVARLNTRLARPIEPFKLARRYDMIQRLIYDPEVTAAVVDHARRNGVPESVAFERARRYAREIVPAFSATLYFAFGARLARWLARSLFRVDVMRIEPEAITGIDPEATVVFVMNHRSNMDYVLVTYLVSDATSLSYAVGEWARFWPLSAIFRMMGAYFIRRRARGQLYRKVLARYVHMATEGGVTQAMFPEGGLSLTGRMAEPKLGLFSYILEDFDPTGRDVVFVPVALNYDRVLEDRILIGAAQSGERRFGVPMRRAIGVVLRHLWLRLTRRFRRFGHAGVSFGTPVSAASLTGAGADVAAVSEVVMARIAEVTPVLPVPLVARAVLGGARGDEITRAVAEDLRRLDDRGTPRTDGDPAELSDEALHRLRQRKLVDAEGAPLAGATETLAFYAASIAHCFPEGEDKQ